MKKIITSALLVLFVAVLAACGKKTYTVTFDTAGGSNIAAVKVKSGEKVPEPSTPTKADYIFVEWQLDGNKYDFTAAVTKNITLVAQWEEVPAGKVVVSFNTNGGSAIMPLLVEEGSVEKAPKAPTRDFQVFDGWYADEELKEAFDFSKPITENIVLHAKWKPTPYTAQNTYRTYLGNVPNMNPHSITMADASTLYSLVSGTLYSGDYDWDAIIEAGALAEADRGDLTKVTYGGAYKDAGELPFNYFPEMATERPIDVNGDGTLWEIRLRNDLKFADEAET
ncbi:MAG: InlB B-repeat-containing protein, partial [Acholeplasmataceae bacterium]